MTGIVWVALLGLGLWAGDAPADTGRGRQVYNAHCYFCHGYSGDARTLAATYLSPPPRNFLGLGPEDLSRERMLQGVAAGRPGTAMQGFSGVLSAADMEAVVDFVRTTFMGAKAANLDYHSEVNGWQPHGGESAAIPFARGDLALDTPWEALTPAQREGKRLFLATCVSCHDHGRVADPGPAWRAQAISYPRAGYVPGAGLDGISGASPYRLHERAPALPQAGEAERRGEALFQGNCAFCHGADGTGRNWIGSFLERAPRDLTSRRAMAGMSRERLAEVIRTGLPGTSMPAWGAVLSREQIEDLVAYLARAFNTVP